MVHRQRQQNMGGDNLQDLDDDESFDEKKFYMKFKVSLLQE